TVLDCQRGLPRHDREEPLVAFIELWSLIQKLYNAYELSARSNQWSGEHIACGVFQQFADMRRNLTLTDRIQEKRLSGGGRRPHDAGIIDGEFERAQVVRNAAQVDGPRD